MFSKKLKENEKFLGIFNRELDKMKKQNGVQFCKDLLTNNVSSDLVKFLFEFVRNIVAFVAHILDLVNILLDVLHVIISKSSHLLKSLLSFLG